MGQHLWHLGISLTEKGMRTAAIYLGIAVLLRLAGKRDLAQLNTFDLVVMLLLSNVVQNAIIGDDLSVSGGLAGAAMLVGLNALVVRLVARSTRLARWFEGSPTTLVTDGSYDLKALRSEGLRQQDVEVALRRQNANDVSEVARAVLAPGGAVVVTLRPEEENATKGDLEEMERRLMAKLAKPEKPAKG